MLYLSLFKENNYIINLKQNWVLKKKTTKY